MSKKLEVRIECLEKKVTELSEAFLAMSDIIRKQNNMLDRDKEVLADLITGKLYLQRIDGSETIQVQTKESQP